MSGNPDAPRRGASDASSEESELKGAKTGDVEEDEMGDLTCTQRQALGMPDDQVVLTVAYVQLRRAGQDPNRGWPAYEVTYPIGGLALVPRDPIAVSGNYRNLDANSSWVASAPTEPLPITLAAPGPARGGVGDIRALAANPELLRDLAGKDSQVWDTTGTQGAWRERMP